MNKAPIMKRKPNFTHVPNWMGIYNPGKITINNPEFHYYVSRSEQDQPVTLYVPQEEDEACTSMRMYYTIERQQHLSERPKDSSGIKDFGYLQQMQQEEINKIPINKDSITKQSSWVKKYEPKRFIDLLTDELINRNLLTWLKSWDAIVFKKNHKIDTVPSLFKKTGSKGNYNSFYSQDFNYKKLVLLAGPPGCGKTTLARVIASHCGYHWEEINASDDRSGRTLIQKIDNLVTNQTIRSEKKPTCVIIDEVDGALDSDSNGIKEVLNYLETGVVTGDPIKKEKTEKNAGKKHLQGSKHHQPHHLEGPSEKEQKKSYKFFGKKEGEEEQKRRTKINRPVIFICNDPFVKGLRDLRGKAIVVHFNTLQQDKVVKRLKEITDEEGIYIESQVLKRICQMCNNDVRSAVGILELIVSLKKQLGVSAREISNRMRFSYNKDINSSTNDFLGKVMQPSKLNPDKDLFKTYQYTLSQHDNHGLLTETFFHNILHNKNLFYSSHALSRLYNQITNYDVALRQSFKLQSDPQDFAIFPYTYYRIHIRTEDQKRMEFPSQFFEKFNQKKANMALLEKIHKGIPTNLLMFISTKSLVTEYLYAFWLSMQTSSIREEDVLKCVYKLLSYGVKLAGRFSQHLFSPEFDVLLAFGGNKAEIAMSNASKQLMQENYEFLKLKSQLAGDAILDNSKQNLESVINQLKKNRRRKRDSQNGQVKYKYLEGTGTEVKYDLKIGYFFQQKSTI